MAQARLVTLTTDLGHAYAAQMKAVLFRFVPPAHVVDISHDLTGHGVDEASFLLRHVAPQFPPGTVHVAVVDPGVGGSRAPLAVRCREGSFLVGPDNGVLAPLADHLGVASSIRLDPARVVPGRTPSATFEGRDLFAPAAGRLATGGRLASLGSSHSIAPGAVPPPSHRGGWALGRIVHVDRFGNAISNVPTEWFPEMGVTLTLRLGRRQTELPRRRTYADLAPHAIGILGSSFGTLEISVREGRAVDRLRLRVGRDLALREERARADGKYRRP